jgi:hypothetical protein
LTLASHAGGYIAGLMPTVNGSMRSRMMRLVIASARHACSARSRRHFGLLALTVLVRH